MNFNSDFRMLIGGELVDSPQALDVVNPATGQVFATAPDCRPHRTFVVKSLVLMMRRSKPV